MTRILSRREKYMIKMLVLTSVKTVGMILFATYVLSKTVFKGLYKAIRWVYLRYRYKDMGLTQDEIIQKIKDMSPREFEVFTANLFRELGYKTFLTDVGPDGGKDVILDNRIYVECKHYQGYIGRPILQKLEGAIYGDRMEKGILITTGTFHENAIEYAKKAGNIELWDMDAILKAMEQTQHNKVPFILYNVEG